MNKTSKNNPDQRIYTTFQMREAENRSAEFGVSLGELMDNAGNALADTVLRLFGEYAKSAVVLCGNGNNGGDGFVCAEKLSKSEITPTVVAFSEPKTELAINAYNHLSDGIEVLKSTDIEVWDRINCADVIIDAVFGTGFRGELPENAADIFRLCSASNAKIIACDVPSGVDAKSGEVSEGTMRCCATVAFQAVKAGCVIYPAADYCGEIITADIGIPEQVSDAISSVSILGLSDVKKLINHRPKNAHKGTFGKLLCICGSRRYTGAAALSVMAAVRSGAGLCCVASVKSVVDSLSGSVYEPIWLPLSEDENGFAAFDEKDLELLAEEIEKASAVLFGCGLGNNENTLRTLEFIIEHAECPVIIDADGLNALSRRIDILRKARTDIILTPHPAELARLTGQETRYVLADRFSAAKKLSDEYGAVVCAKSAATIISANGRLFLNLTGNTGLSKGGSGDMLAGMIASFCAQGMSAQRSACVGVYVLGLAADRLSEKISERGMTATDVLRFLPSLFKEFE